MHSYSLMYRNKLHVRATLEQQPKYQSMSHCIKLICTVKTNISMSFLQKWITECRKMTNFCVSSHMRICAPLFDRVVPVKQIREICMKGWFDVSTNQRLICSFVESRSLFILRSMLTMIVLNAVVWCWRQNIPCSFCKKHWAMNSLLISTATRLDNGGAVSLVPLQFEKNPGQIFQICANVLWEVLDEEFLSNSGVEYSLVLPN